MSLRLPVFISHLPLLSILYNLYLDTLVDTLRYV